MCGIAGTWGAGSTNSKRNVLHSMMKRLSHRGPDGRGVHQTPEESGLLGHTRLAIMDPKGGSQPIENGTGTRAIAANGEIYNYPLLKKALSDRHRFRTGNDSECALHLFDEVAYSTVQHLDGMFAISIADGESLYLARDPIGIKPLYYSQQNNSIVFASELKALLGHVEKIREFPAGCWFHSDVGFRNYYHVPRRIPRTEPLDIRLRQIREGLEEAVVKRLMSDVPVGAFLSGGLDSSLIAAILRKHLPNLHTFSVGVEGSRDLEAARHVARFLQTVHHEYIITPQDIRQALPEIVYHLESFDQDLVRSGIPCYFTSRLASDYVKVILTGEGADELFGGYTYYKAIRDPEELHRELRRSISSLHNINLQRVDRLTMAHSIEGRVPFLDLKMIELAQTIPTELKIPRERNGEIKEKWVLRKAFEDLLPAEIIWRDKEQFDEGSGTIDVLDTIWSDFMNECEAQEYRAKHGQDHLRSSEEAVYHKLLADAYADPRPILDNVARWAHRGGPPKGPSDIQESSAYYEEALQQIGVQNRASRTRS